jgi:hypothetical protein
MPYDLSLVINTAILAHSGEHATKPSKAVRKWDGKTPYSVHPLWCAMTILCETRLSEQERELGCQVLAYHDILEDTTYQLETTPEVQALVQEMTFESSDAEMTEVWQRSKFVRLLKLFDKVSNLLDGSWMSVAKWNKYTEYTLKLADDVQAGWGELNIVTIARSIAKPRS